MVITAIQMVVSPLIALLVGVLLVGLSRKILARIHCRYGPPIYQPVIDVIRMFSQVSISHGALFELGVVLALAYEVPYLLVILAVMSHHGTISLTEIVARQQAGWWGALSLPLAAVAAFLILPAMLGIRPFDVVSAPQEISSGPRAEYSGTYLALIELQGAVHLFVVLALFVDLFLGGGINIITFLFKMLVVFIAVEMIRAVLPRVRIESAIKFCWTWPVASGVATGRRERVFAAI